RRRPQADASRPGAPRGAQAARRERPAARALRSLGSRPCLVARPDGANLTPAGRADDADLARLVRDLEHRRRLAAADAEPESTLPPPGPRVVPRPVARRDEGPGDASVAERKRQLEGLAERELRAGDDGALRARRRPRLHRGRRPPAGTCPHRLSEQLEPEQRACQLPLRPGVPRSGREDDLPSPGPIHLEGLVPPLRHTSGPPVVLRPEALELLRPRDAGPRHAA